jgi:membrane protein
LTLHIENLRTRLEGVYERADDLSGGSLGILRQAMARFGDTRASQAAAGMAYYALFSLFPLLLVLISIGAFVLDRKLVQERLLAYVTESLPVSQQLVRDNIERVINLRGAVGLVGLIGLLWSASGFFNSLVYNVNRAWPDADARGFLERRLVALGIVVSLAVLLILALAATTLVELLPRFKVPLAGEVSIYEASYWSVISIALPLFIKFVLFLAIYRWLPNAQVGWRAALVGATVATLGWQLVTNIFNWYVSSGLSNYRLVYGSLGAIVALMFWIYLSGWIALFGAHLTAAIGRARGDDQLGTGRV